MMNRSRFNKTAGANAGWRSQFFEPYDKIKEPNPEARPAGAALVKEGIGAGGKRKTFIYVNKST